MLIIKKELSGLLEYNKISRQEFLALANAEDFSQEEIDDIQYMEDKVETWIEEKE